MSERKHAESYVHTALVCARLIKFASVIERKHAVSCVLIARACSAVAIAAHEE